MTNRIDQTFKRLRREGRCGLIAYVTCGDPDPRTTVEIVFALERAGASMIELGVPFSDPIADGPVIQAASLRALQRGTTLAQVFTIAREIRQKSTIPLIAFSYLNPILRFGVERFAGEAAASGFDGVLITDLPPESSKEIRSSIRSRGMRMIFLLSPTSSAQRISMIDRLSEGFVYYVSTTGVTGVRKELDPSLLGRITELRARLGKPLVVGFGVSSHEHYLALQGSCDAVVVGSAIVRAAGEGDPTGAPTRAARVVSEILGT